MWLNSLLLGISDVLHLHRAFLKSLVNARQHCGGCRTVGRGPAPPRGAAFTGTPPVTTVINSSIAPKPFRSPKYRWICAASTGGATRDPPSTLATSPTTPLYCHVKVVQMSASLYSCTCLPRASRFFLPSFSFSACQLCTIGSACGRLSASPSGSRERADPLIVRDSTGANVCLATRGQRVLPRPGSDGHCFGPATCVCSST